MSSMFRHPRVNVAALAELHSAAKELTHLIQYAEQKLINKMITKFNDAASYLSQ